MFDTARLRLTLWYLAILAAIVGLLSLLLYRTVLSLQQTEALAISPPERHGIVQIFSHNQATLAWQIGGVDAVVLVLAALGAYVLAGRTLRPIAAAMQRQQRFAIAASHELRTPLTVLQGSLEVALLKRRTPEEYEHILLQSAAEAQHMGVLIADLLALARAESDAAVLTRLPVDLSEIAREAAAAIAPLAERKQQSLEIDLAGPLPLHADGPKLRQAVTNLLDNAVSYTPEGGAIRLTGRREHGGAVLAVRDTGKGIEPEHLPHLFEPFYRAELARGGDHAGLGLALAAWIAHAHGGRLEVESRPGVGSVFTLSVPK